MSALGLRLLAIALVALAALTGCGNHAETQPATVDAGNERLTGATSERPNVIVILSDDMGFSDISAFGSEIQTPNIDSLADQGVAMTNFHATPLCATSRAALLTGADQHLVGVGTLPLPSKIYPPKAQQGNYKAELDTRAVTIATPLRKAGYHTYMAGKWHVGDGGPVKHGFEQSFSLAYDAAFGSNFSPAAPGGNPGQKPYFENGKQVKNLPPDFFSTDYFTSKLIDYIGADHGDGKPFFAYLAPQATHFPIQAPARYLDCGKGEPGCYKGVYDAGYAAIRKQRIKRMKDLGIIPTGLKPNPGDEVPMLRFGQPGVLLNEPWNLLTPKQKTSEARLMEVYAAMVTDLDDQVGRLIDYLKSIGEYDNTMILFVSDNGPDGIGHVIVPYIDDKLNADLDNSLDNYGRPGSAIFRSGRWAEVGSTPFRLFKGFTAEGGISVPAIIKMPGGAHLPPSNAFARLEDVAPTVYALAGIAAHGDTYAGRHVAPIEGESLLPVLEGRRDRVHGPDEVIADESLNVRSVRKGPWKLTRFASYILPASVALLLPHRWQLYNMQTDRGETRDLSAEYPEKRRELINAWDDYAEHIDFAAPILPSSVPPLLQKTVRDIDGGALNDAINNLRGVLAGLLKPAGARQAAASKDTQSD